jgi:hypothetical protein
MEIKEKLLRLEGVNLQKLLEFGENRSPIPASA